MSNPNAVSSHMRLLLLAPAVLMLGFALLACTDDPDDIGIGLDDVEPGGTEIAIDREQILGELSEVRDLFEARSPLPPELISDVSYDDEQLHVTLAQEAEGAEQAEQVCRDLSEAIQLPDLSITVDGPDGAQLASCEFGQ